MLSVSIFPFNVNKMSNFNGSIFNSEIKNHSFKIFTLEIKWILYFFLAYFKILIVSLQSILKSRTFFKKKVSFEPIVEHDYVFSLLIFDKEGRSLFQKFDIFFWSLDFGIYFILILILKYSVCK